MSQETTANVRVEFIIGPNWMHTHGMEEAGFPELEMRGIPSFLAGPAANLLNSVCEYMTREGKRVAAGETMSSHGAAFRFVKPVPLPGEEGHYEAERLQIVDIDRVCECCGDTTSIDIPDAEREDEAHFQTVEVVLTDPDDPDVFGRLAALAGSFGGESLGRHEVILREEVEVEEFGFQLPEAAEAFARASQVDEAVCLARIWVPPDGPAE